MMISNALEQYISYGWYWFTRYHLAARIASELSFILEASEKLQIDPQSNKHLHETWKYRTRYLYALENPTACIFILYQTRHPANAGLLFPSNFVKEAFEKNEALFLENSKFTSFLIFFAKPQFRWKKHFKKTI